MGNTVDEILLSAGPQAIIDADFGALRGLAITSTDSNVGEVISSQSVELTFTTVAIHPQWRCHLGTSGYCVSNKCPSIG